MKTLRYIVVVIGLTIGASLLKACSGYIIEVGPPAPPNEVVIIAPSPRHVWVPGYYTFRGGTYIWIEGTYRVPPRGKSHYVQGQWMKTPKGYKRGKGHWK